jgi:membrane protein required for beta-lactamase induction
MNLIALLLGLLLERGATRLLHLRELRWLDPYFDWCLARLDQLSSATVLLAVVLVVLPVLPIFWLQQAFAHALFGLLYIAFAAFVLLFSLGPRDLGSEVDDYAEAVASGDAARIDRTAKILTESDLPSEGRVRVLAVEEAVLVQANNRIFGVIFWFMVLGPAGAWLFRVADLMRRRAVFEAGRKTSAGAAVPGYLPVVQSIYGVFAWIPARLLALGYAMAGSFEEAVSDWKTYYETCSDKFFHVNDAILAAAGRGALREEEKQAETFPLGPVRAAMKLVRRTLLVWVTVISLLTVAGQVA